jgi:hypothetical protein
MTSVNIEEYDIGEILETIRAGNFDSLNQWASGDFADS